MARSEDFYRNLSPASSFAQASELQYYERVPDDWSVVIGDIRGSTAAISAGKYKSVNMVGAAVITTVLNACSEFDIPFVFGGDGAGHLLGAGGDGPEGHDLNRASGGWGYRQCDRPGAVWCRG